MHVMEKDESAVSSPLDRLIEKASENALLSHQCMDFVNTRQNFRKGKPIGKQGKMGKPRQTESQRIHRQIHLFIH